MVSSAKAAVPTVSDQAAAMQLSQCAKNLATSLAELRTASQKASGALCQWLALQATSHLFVMVWYEDCPGCSTAGRVSQQSRLKNIKDSTVGYYLA